MSKFIPPNSRQSSRISIAKSKELPQPQPNPIKILSKKNNNVIKSIDNDIDIDDINIDDDDEDIIKPIPKRKLWSVKTNKGLSYHEKPSDLSLFASKSKNRRLVILGCMTIEYDEACTSILNENITNNRLKECEQTYDDENDNILINNNKTKTKTTKTSLKVKNKKSKKQLKRILTKDF
jgi:hypothetical protein